MAIQINEVLQPFWYTYDGYDDDKTPAKFKIKPLTGLDLSYLTQFAEVAESGAVLLSVEGIKQYLIKSVIDWKNVNGADKKKLKFNAENLLKLPSEIALDLVNAIRARSVVSGEELKNS